MKPAQPATVRPDRFGERCLSSVFMIVFGVLYLDGGTEMWARVMSWTAIVVGTAATLYFGTRFVQQQRRQAH